MEESQNFQTILIDDTHYQTSFSKKFQKRETYIPPNPKLIVAFIPGTIREVYVKAGQSVKKGELLLVLEAMKMKNKLLAPFDGFIKLADVKTGQTVIKNQVLVEFE